jgi:hypothetical protein
MGVENSFSRTIAIGLVLLLLITPFASLAPDVLPSASAEGGTRHIYTFAGGAPDAMALYTGSTADRTTKISIPKGAEILDVEMTLSGASSTGWSSVSSATRDDWMSGTSVNIDQRSEDLAMGLESPESLFFGHALDETTTSPNSAWLDNGTYSIRQTPLSNSSESRFTMQQQFSSSTFMYQSQGAILSHHGWLFLSKWSGNNPTKMINRLYANNATRESTITFDQANCQLQPVYPSTYYGQYGFRDWTLGPDEKLYGILSGYKNHYNNNLQTPYERVVKIDVRYDDVWTCEEVYDISSQFGDYSAISYDRIEDKIWVVHNSGRRLVSYDFQDNGYFERDSSMFTFQSSNTHKCGKSGGLVRGLAVHGSIFFMRCKDTDSSWPPKDVLNAWAVSGTSTSLVAQPGVSSIQEIGYGLQYDGQRLLTQDCGYYSWGGGTLYYRQYGSGIQYPTNPAPGTSTWIGEPIEISEDLVAVNMETSWSATSAGDRVDYWVSADNGTHWESVESNNTIHFSFPGNVLRWKMQLIGSSSVSWWVNLEYASSYETTGVWTSAPIPTGTEVGKVRPSWVATTPSGTSVSVLVSNDNGSSWTVAQNGVDTDFSNDGNILRYNIQLDTSDDIITPLVSSFTLEYLEGFPDKVEIDIGDDGTWDWKGVTFLGDSSVIASDASIVGSEVSDPPTLVQAFNDHAIANGLGTEDIVVAIRAHSSGRILLSNLDLTYRLNTRVLDAKVEGGVLVPDGELRTLVVRVAPGDGVSRIDRVVADFMQNDANPILEWALGDSCSLLSNGSGKLIFDSGNCTSTSDVFGIVSIHFPIMSTWDWDDQVNLELNVSVNDNFGVAVAGWATEDLNLRVENDIQLNGMRVVDETNRELWSNDWLRGGYNLTFSGGINFENTQISPESGQFMLRILGQNLTMDGDPNGDAPVLLHEEPNPSHGSYSMTFTSPQESAPGGMLFSVEAFNLTNGSIYANQQYNTIRLILDGNSPLVLDATPVDGSEMHKGPPAPGGQSVSITIQDSVDPPTQISLNYWLGCTSRHEYCSDTNFNGLPEPVEYRTISLTTPEMLPGGINIFQGLIDDSMLIHGEKVAIFVSGQDGQGNVVAMGGSSVCSNSGHGNGCGSGIGEIEPEWENSLVNYHIREEFEPTLIVENSTIIGHDDRAPLHPGVPYNLILQIGDGNGWSDIAGLHLALAGDFDDDETSIWVTFGDLVNGVPSMHLESGGAGLAVSNLYSMVAPDFTNESLLMVNLRFQLTWNFPEKWDTDGVDLFIPKLEVWDRPCSEIELIPCHEEKAGLGNDVWSLDNDLRFDTAQGHITAIELRNGANHYYSDETESLIGAGQVVRFSGRIMFSEDATPAPAGALDVQLSDYEYEWITQPQNNGYFTMDFLVPSVRSGHLDLYASLSNLPGLATDQTIEQPRLRLAIDSLNPIISDIAIGGVASGESISLSDVSNLRASLETWDDSGFDESLPTMMHYVLRAGESEVSRGSVMLTEPTVFEEQIFWIGQFDLTDGGATSVLPTYSIDVWVTGADAAGNPFNADSNTESSPLGTWTFIWNGPEIDLSDELTVISWDDPSPHLGQVVNLQIDGVSLNGVGGNVQLLLEEYDGENWISSGESEIEVHPTKPFHSEIEYTVANIGTFDRHTFRLRLMDGNLELDRISVSPLLMTEEISRDGQALVEQVSDSRLAVVLYFIAIGAACYGMYTMVIHRRFLRDEDEENVDYTDSVVEEMGGKETPELPPGFVPVDVNNPPPPPFAAAYPPQPTLPPQPSPPTTDLAPLPLASLDALSSPPAAGPPIPAEGLPQGWTEDQWVHYGQKWLEENA